MRGKAKLRSKYKYDFKRVNQHLLDELIVTIRNNNRIYWLDYPDTKKYRYCYVRLILQAGAHFKITSDSTYMTADYKDFTISAKQIELYADYTSLCYNYCIMLFPYPPKAYQRKNCLPYIVPIEDFKRGLVEFEGFYTE